ncbi:hypothetical protein V4R08_05745 [Nitrobacter sp. NHB1]|uniref:hypothetical protein n=1 Tax=Nitrobacter sp. NHB1 TaxID=3119830 RepID=UPI002FFFBE88
MQAGFDPVKAFSTEADTGSREKKRVKSKSWTPLLIHQKRKGSHEKHRQWCYPNGPAPIPVSRDARDDATLLWKRGDQER